MENKIENGIEDMLMSLAPFGKLEGCNDIEKIIDILKKVRADKGMAFTCGNGGSAGTASHMACDLVLTGKVASICLNDNPSAYSALINDEGWENVYFRLLPLMQKSFASDCLIVFSVHGGAGKGNAKDWSQNLNKAIDFAKSHGMYTIGFSGGGGGYFNNCDVNLVVPSESTAVVESVHACLAHLIAFVLGGREI